MFVAIINDSLRPLLFKNTADVVRYVRGCACSERCASSGRSVCVATAFFAGIVLLPTETMKLRDQVQTLRKLLREKDAWIFRAVILLRKYTQHDAGASVFLQQPTDFGQVRHKRAIFTTQSYARHGIFSISVDPERPVAQIKSHEATISDSFFFLNRTNSSNLFFCYDKPSTHSLEKMDNSDMTELKYLVRNSYCPYSNIRVSCIAVCKNGRYTGVNVENVSYALTTCAEAAAISASVTGGMKKGDLDKVLIYSDSVDSITPCGACRQIIAEFAHKGTTVVTLGNRGNTQVDAATSLLPLPFTII